MMEKKSSANNKKKPGNMTKKKRSTPTKKQHKLLSEVPGEFCFMVVDGSSLKSVSELLDKIEEISEDVFNYHVTDERNDFANWVRDVFDEKELAERLFESKTREQAHIALLKHFLKKLKEASKV